MKVNQFRCLAGAVLLCMLAGAAAPVRAQPDPNAPPAAYYPRSDWNMAPDTMIMSSHAFHDVNRNGIYELGERPLAKIAFRMVRPDGVSVLSRTNIDGFANWQMASDPQKGDFFAPGTYNFIGVVPPGWSATSDNLTQQRRIRRLAGSPAGLVSEDLPVSIGFAPDLWIKGRLTGPSAAGALVRVRGPNGERSEIQSGTDGRFDVAASSGRWEIEVGGHVRTVDVRLAPVQLSAFDPAAGRLPGQGTATVIDFDDLLSSRAILELPNGFAGLNWWSWVAVQNRMYNGEGYLNGTISGDVAIYNSSGHPAQISRARPFDFVGGYFTVAWGEAEGEVLRIRAWRDDRLLHEDAVTLSSLGPVWFDADYRGVTRIDFSTDHYWQAVADDLTVRR